MRAPQHAKVDKADIEPDIAVCESRFFMIAGKPAALCFAISNR
jgi:hypothetical protein